MEKIKKIPQNIVAVKGYMVRKWIDMDLAMLLVLVVVVRLSGGIGLTAKGSRYDIAKSGGIYRSMAVSNEMRMMNLHTIETYNSQHIEKCLHNRNAVPVYWTENVSDSKERTQETASYKMDATDRENTMMNDITAPADFKEKKKTVTDKMSSAGTSVEETAGVIATDTDESSRTDTADGNLEEENVLTDMLILDGFAINSNGVIEYCEDLELVLNDGMLVFPADARCTGIGAGALEKITEAVEAYIPANIISIAPGVLDHIGNLMYIEVSPDNPVYESRDGVLYTKSGELVSYPSGR